MRDAYRNISSETIHKLWELYSVDYAMFNYPYPDDLGPQVTTISLLSWKKNLNFHLSNIDLVAKHQKFTVKAFLRRAFASLIDINDGYKRFFHWNMQKNANAFTRCKQALKVNSHQNKIGTDLFPAAFWVDSGCLEYR